MTGYPTLLVAVLQSLLTSAIMLTPPLIYAFAGRKLKTSFGDVLLMACTIPALMLVSSVVFIPFEGDWADVALGPLAPLRSLLVGGIALTLATAFTQRKAMARRGAAEATVRLAAAFLVGAVWGSVWGFAGWFLQYIGMTGNG